MNIRPIIMTCVLLLSIGEVNATPVRVSVAKKSIPTYVPCDQEQLPMFAENRVHQRTSGNPYPNKVVVQVQRDKRQDVDYTVITLENEYLRLELLPELGGRIFSAVDKTNNYDFFYHQHVIKPALIGVLGNWISGGVEFNWPYHHRPSTFMPTDYQIEHLANGGVIVWMSEHEPVDRMKGMVGIVLNPGEAIFETRVRLSNITPQRHSFLWWENAAVPSNQHYEIFFPHDVSHVFFHYKRSVTTYPVASNAMGIFNGVYYDGPTAINEHKNTLQPTSYFSAASQFDFFGGYDHHLEAGVVHIGDHHVSKGKKMFTWAYNQLSTSWEKALTDTDGAYCELMASSYSDNQPDFTWIEPMETKCFSQYWYPIGKIGVPDFANIYGAVYSKEGVAIQLTSTQAVTIQVGDYQTTQTLKAREAFRLPSDVHLTNGQTLLVTDMQGKELISYTPQTFNTLNIASLTTDMPNIAKAQTAYELYLEGVHVAQYRDPLIHADSYYKQALQRDPTFAPALIALGEYYYGVGDFQTSNMYLQRAYSSVTRFNKHTEDGRLYYQMGLTLLALDYVNEAYDAFQQAAWSTDHITSAMTWVGMIDLQRNQPDLAIQHLKTALNHDANNNIANAFLIYALYRSGQTKQARMAYDAAIARDPLDHLARWMGVEIGVLKEHLYFSVIKQDPSQVLLDMIPYLMTAGMQTNASRLISLLAEPNYSLGAIQTMLTNVPINPSLSEGIAFPSRPLEAKALRVLADKGDLKATYLLSCYLYHNGQYQQAVDGWLKCTDNYAACRNIAVAYYTHLNRKAEVLPWLDKALSLRPDNQQLIFESVYVMGKLNTDPIERLQFLEAHRSAILRDDILLEWARAYTMAGQEDKAIELLMSHSFIPCEGGEHAVAEQYMYAYFIKGQKALRKGLYQQAADFFHRAQFLPQNLGAGLWNKVRLVPFKYYEAVCLQELGDTIKAKENYDFILGFQVDYFSDMNLKSLPIYQALTYRQLGQNLAANACLNYRLQDWLQGLKIEDAGWFSATPFFLSYVDDAPTMRRAFFCDLLHQVYRFMGDEQLADYYGNQARLNDPYSISIFAELFVD